MRSLSHHQFVVSALALVAGALVAAPLVGTTAQAAPRTTAVTKVSAVQEVDVRPRTLLRGHVPQLAWVVSNVLHTADGRRHTLPWSKHAAMERSLTLLGRSDVGWVVSDYEPGIGIRAYVVAHGAKRFVDVMSEGSDYRSWFVARDGTSLLKGESEDGRTGYLEVTRLHDGVTVGHLDFSGRGWPLDFTGQQALVTDGAGTALWPPGGSAEALGAVAVAGDIAHDLLFVPGSTAGSVGPTRLSDPGAPSWTAPLTDIQISPDGRYILGRVVAPDTEQRHLQVRRVSDGALVAAFHVRLLSRTLLQWESPRSIIFEMSKGGLGDVNAFGRCRLNGTCTRATAWRHLRLFSIERPRLVMP